MNVAKTSVMLANIEVRVLGEYSIEEALAAFDTFPWAEELARTERLEAEGKDCVSPDMTFSMSPFHFTVTVHDTSPTLDVELCVPKRGKILGLTTRSTKFFEFKKVSRAHFEELLRAFFDIPADDQFAFFSKLQ
jgi:hypothetical protein